MESKLHLTSDVYLVKFRRDRAVGSYNSYLNVHKPLYAVRGIYVNSPEVFESVIITDLIQFMFISNGANSFKLVRPVNAHTIPETLTHNNFGVMRINYSI